MDNAKLEVLDHSVSQTFFVPIKKINEGHHVSRFLVSKAYRDIMAFVLQLNRAMFPCIIKDDVGNETKTHVWKLEPSDVIFSDTVVQLRELLQNLNNIIDEVPPDPGPRRFGNVNFKKWYELVEARIAMLLECYLPPKTISFNSQSNVKAEDELQSYLLGSFGSPQRLDYGTGHELSFLAFLGCIWKLGGFDQSASGNEERGIVLGVFQSYLQLTRRLIQTYTLEPAGSHGVWGLDDHFFLPYLFGSAQYGPVLSSEDPTPVEGSRANAPDPGDVAKKNAVERERMNNMYFSAIGFIYDVKKGPFWEHSPILYDISGVRAGWAKINKGMIKMFMAEVLSKFPVVQHFYFGALFSWEQDLTAVPPPKSAHSMNQPVHGDLKSLKSNRKGPSAEASSNLSQQSGTRAPWASPSVATLNAFVGTAAPWARNTSATDPTMAFPNRNSQQPPTSLSSTPRDMEPNKPGSQGMPPPTQAPWAKDGE